MRLRSASACAVFLLAGCHDLGNVKPPVSPNVDRTDSGVNQPEVSPPEVSPPDMAAPDMGPSVPALPSCQGLPSTCGPDGNDSCCASDPIAGGQFSRGYDRSMTSKQDGEDVVGWQAEGAATALLTAYELDRYEVTVGRFRKFLAAFDGWKQNNPETGAGKHPMIVGSGWKGEWTNKADRYGQSAAEIRKHIEMTCGASGRVVQALNAASGADDNRPMPCVSWHEAMLFCIWDRGRLPTEAEWNYAAAGGEQQNPFPWGESASAADVKLRANIERGSDDFSLTTPVGTAGNKLGKSRYGQYDMAGNVLEWVAGTCDDCKIYTQPGATNPYEIAQANPICRGGSFKYPAVRARTAFRLAAGHDTRFRYIDLGWRCARNP